MNRLTRPSCSLLSALRDQKNPAGDPSLCLVTPLPLKVSKIPGIHLLPPMALRVPPAKWSSVPNHCLSLATFHGD